MRLKAATLAVGTEVVDGQITDRNSAWISDKCVVAGLEVIEHRAVPDDREKIAEALRQLSEKCDVLFVTGGLGPTSDDFTRDLIADVFNAPLEFDPASWDKIVKRFEARGAVAKPIQRQQCFFPKGALILENPAGTANAFSLQMPNVMIVTLPGPPAEIAAVWDLHLAKKIESLVPAGDHEDLHLWQTLGLGEGDIAEKVEEAIKGSGLRVGYRVHLPYVEVKVWVRRIESTQAHAYLENIERALKEWTVAHGKQDAADCIIKAAFAGHNIAVLDRVTGGYVQSRLFDSLNSFRKAHPGLEPKGSLRVTTSLLSAKAEPQEMATGDAVVLSLVSDPDSKQWHLKMVGAHSQTLAVQPTPLYNFGTERGQKYMAEKMFHALSRIVPFDCLEASVKD